MIAVDELKKLPIEERRQIVEELTKSITEEEHAVPDPPDHAQENSHVVYFEHDDQAIYVHSVFHDSRTASRLDRLRKP